MRSVTETKNGAWFEKAGRKKDKVCVLVGLHITRKQGRSGHNPHTVFLREAECDDDETTDDSRFTVKGCKGNARSHT